MQKLVAQVCTVILVELGNGLEAAGVLCNQSPFEYERQDIGEFVLGDVSLDVGHELHLGDIGKRIADSRATENTKRKDSELSAYSPLVF